MELQFKSDTRTRKWRQTAKSFQHPAKMVLPLQLWLIERYTKPGDWVADVMAGSGTILLACALGRNVIALDLEQKFVDIMKGNWERIQEVGPELGCTMGKAVILQGDARDLEGILGRVDIELFSPPYAKEAKGISQTEYDKKQSIVNKLRRERGDIKGGVGRSGALGKSTINPNGYSENPDNIGSLPYGSMPQVAIFSPPYSDITGKGKQRSEVDGAYPFHYSDNPANIGNLEHGSIDAVISSPPYEGSEARDRSKEASFDRETSGKYTKRGDLNISKGYQPDVILTSPPYEGSVSSEKSGIDWSKGTRGKAEGNKPRDRSKEPAFNYLSIGGAKWKYGNAEGNIGNLKCQNYLSEMLKVYHACYAVLRPGGLLVLVLKNFIRDKKIVDLVADTRLLCENADFTFFEEHYRVLSQQSFWRTIALQKCDHRRGSKQDPRCKLGLACPVKEELQLSLEERPKTQAEVIEKLCPEFRNSSPSIDQEFVEVFRKR